MKYALLILATLIAIGQAAAQGRKPRATPLEPLLPFADAVAKAKASDPQGFYALAVHYALGREIECSSTNAFRFLRKAADANYGNAVFVLAMTDERSSLEEPFCGIPQYSIHDAEVPMSRYIDFPLTWGRDVPITNAAKIASIRTGYRRAIGLGVSAATNELARFERRAANIEKQLAEKAAADERKKANARLVDGL